MDSLLCSGLKMVCEVRELATFMSHKFAGASDRLMPVSVNSPCGSEGPLPKAGTRLQRLAEMSPDLRSG